MPDDVYDVAAQRLSSSSAASGFSTIQGEIEGLRSEVDRLRHVLLRIAENHADVRESTPAWLAWEAIEGWYRGPDGPGKPVPHTASEQSEVARLREVLAQSKGSVRLLAEDLEYGRATPLDVAQALHNGADVMATALEATREPEAPRPVGWSLLHEIAMRGGNAEVHHEDGTIIYGYVRGFSGSFDGSVTLGTGDKTLVTVPWHCITEAYEDNGVPAPAPDAKAQAVQGEFDELRRDAEESAISDEHTRRFDGEPVPLEEPCDECDDIHYCLGFGCARAFDTTEAP